MGALTRGNLLAGMGDVVGDFGCDGEVAMTIGDGRERLTPFVEHLETAFDVGV